MSVLIPPGVDMSWTATSLGTAFGGYRVYRRPCRIPVAPWTQIGELAVPTGYTPAVVEVQHIRFSDNEPGWGAGIGQWADGWDYAVADINSTTGIESQKSLIQSRKAVTANDDAWITCNNAPYLDCPVSEGHSVSGNTSSRLTTYEVLGRDRYVTRARGELGGRTYSLGVLGVDQTSGEDQMRYLRAAANAGRTLCLNLPLGDRYLGSLEVPSTAMLDDSLMLDAGLTFIETATDAQIVGAQYNLPAGLALDGTADTVTHPDTGNLLDPASSAFTVIVAAGLFPATNTYAISKGNLGTADGYGIRRSGGSWGFFVDGATTSGGPSVVDATTEDGNQHVLVGTSSGTAQVLYRDGTSIAVSSVTHGSIANAIALAVGANNGGASGFMATWARSWAVYMRVLTPAEVTAASRYLLGYPGYRMPGGASLFVDLRDDRCWNGQAATVAVTDLSGNNLTGTIVSAPPVRGIPWKLSDLDRPVA